MKAVCTNQLKVVQQLVDAGADVARSDKDGNNVLHLAALNLHRPMVVYLLKHRLVLDDLGVVLIIILIILFFKNIIVYLCML